MVGLIGCRRCRRNGSAHLPEIDDDLKHRRAAVTLSARKTTPDQTSNLRGIVLMVISMSGFAVGDALMKLASQGGVDGASVGQMLAFQGLFGLLAFGLLMRHAGDRITWDLVSDRAVVWRTISDIGSACAFVTALTLMPLGNASAILQFQPIVVTLGAVFFLGETVRWRRWSAIAGGFVGVMIIIRPGLDGFTSASFYVLVAVAGLTVRDLLTRVLNPKHSTLAISFFVSAAIIPAGLALHLVSGSDWFVSTDRFLYLLASSGFVMGAYYALTQSLRIGEISAVAPYRYTRLVAAFLAAYVLLGEKPDHLTLAGSGLVVAAGLFVLYRERSSGSD